jgi:hypothetical protein
MRKAILIMFVLPALSFSQADKKPDVWEPLRFFVGSWEGSGKGQPGSSTIGRDYQFVLNGKFLQVKNKSTYSPQQANPKGEVHEDWGLFSYDRNRKLFVLRQFHLEGFVNQYVLDQPVSGAKALTFVSEGIENIPPGWRARETYRIVDANQFTETFELAAPGKQFELYTEGHFKRKK